MADRFLFVGGPHDGTWRELDAGTRSLELPAEPGLDLPRNLASPVIYLRTELDVGDGQPPLVFYRLSTMTARQAAAWVLAGYGKGQS